VDRSADPTPTVVDRSADPTPIVVDRSADPTPTYAIPYAPLATRFLIAKKRVGLTEQSSTLKSLLNPNQARLLHRIAQALQLSLVLFKIYFHSLNARFGNVDLFSTGTRRTMTR